MEPPQDPAIPLFGIYSKVVKSADKFGYKFINVNSSTTHNSQDMMNGL